MDLPTIEVSEEEATAKLAEYEALLAEERTAEDEAIAQAYRAARRGHQVIRLTSAIAAGAFFDDGLPRIGIAGALWSDCWVRWRGDDIVFSDEGFDQNRGALVGRSTVRVPMRNVAIPENRRWRSARAPIPLVPPRHRPKPSRLRHCHVLWEVEAWVDVPSRDPALVRHIRGDLWAVLATWNLTQLEMAVLAQRSA